MKLSISNIIWPKGEENLKEFFKQASSSGFQGVELALSCFWDEPVVVPKSKQLKLKETLTKYGLEVSGLHSITFTREDLELFGSEAKREELSDYFKRYIEIAENMNCCNIVFGSPKARKRNGLDPRKCDEIFINFLTKIDSNSSAVKINIEPLPAQYCEYLNYFLEVVSLVKRGKFSNINVQLDVRCFIENREAINSLNDNFDLVSHCQVSDPGFSIPTNTYLETHREVCKTLIQKSFSGFIAGEILSNSTNFKMDLEKSYKALSSYYAST